MQGSICSDQRCPLCGSIFFHDENRDGLFCPKHPEQQATKNFRVRFGKKTHLRFQTYQEAQQALGGLRFKKVEGSYDPRDYQRDHPLAFSNLSEKWIIQKRRSKISKKQCRQYECWMERARKVWGNRNIKLIGEGEVEDFLFDDHRNKQGNPIADKTRANLRSCLHDFFKWVERREKRRSGYEAPEIPHVSFELKWRKITDVETQQKILCQLQELSWHLNPKIWYAVKLLCTYPKVRPGELRKVKEGDICRRTGVIHIKHPKEGSLKRGKYIYLTEEDLSLLREFPPSVNPDSYFFRHVPGHRGTVPGKQFGKGFLKIWWDKACKALGIDGLDMYGGTRHTTVTALGEFLTPEEIKRGGTGHVSRAFERYMQPDRREAEKVTAVISQLHKKAQLIEFPAGPPLAHLSRGSEDT